MCLALLSLERQLVWARQWIPVSAHVPLETEFPGALIGAVKYIFCGDCEIGEVLMDPLTV
jgi:hypothetical protein